MVGMATGREAVSSHIPRGEDAYVDRLMFVRQGDEAGPRNDENVKRREAKCSWPS